MNKYRARKTVIDGLTFDSKSEGNYYLTLKQKEQEGAIEGFKTQPRYLLEEGFKKNGKNYRKIEYIADFEIYHLDGSIEVIDVKPSKNYKTEVYKIKKKLFERRYPDLSITEVNVDDIKQMSKVRKRKDI